MHDRTVKVKTYEERKREKFRKLKEQAEGKEDEQPAKHQKVSETQYCTPNNAINNSNNDVALSIVEKFDCPDPTTHRTQLLSTVNVHYLSPHFSTELQRALGHSCMCGVVVDRLLSGESSEQRLKLLSVVQSGMSSEKLRVASLSKPLKQQTMWWAIIQCVDYGIDLFEFGWIHQLSRDGMALTFPNHPNSNPQRFTTLLSVDEHFNMKAPILQNCPCFTCQHHTLAYIHHLFRVNEMNAQILIDLHNYTHLQNFFGHMRNAIEKGDEAWELYKRQMQLLLDISDSDSEQR